uniref:Polymerase PA n=1 Tax=Cryptocercus meridianus orthomyxovirus 2 TaxID=3133493 RepID=A0AAT9JF72_9ORTO
METKSLYEALCMEGQLYPHDFVERMGFESVHWENNNWFQRETSLRHDMVCMLLCNLEPISNMMDDKIEDILGPPEKKKKLDEIENVMASTSSSSSSSHTQKLVSSYGLDDMGDDSLYRYVLLEGRSNVIQIQNKLCDQYNIDKLSRMYDIFDREESKFCEIKVTLNFNNSYEEYISYLDERKNICLMHINPEHLNFKMIDKNENFPGLGKAISFLARRLTLMRMLGIQDPEIDLEIEISKSIFCNERFNGNCTTWIKSFWDLRKMELRKDDRNPTVPHPIKRILESKLKECLEDTTKREGDFMQFKGKILPGPFTHSEKMEVETDAEMITKLMEDRKFNNEIMDWIVEQWCNSKDTFKFVEGKQLYKVPKRLREDLGIGMKKSYRNDGHPMLKQIEFDEPEKKRYSCWMSNLMKDLTRKDKNNLNYFEDLQKEEMGTSHPMGKVCQQIVNKIFQLFGETELAAYCSVIKNFYSRLGGAYLKRGSNNNKRPAMVIFPLYSSGIFEGKKVRGVTGFVIRGPQHAKKSTDRIPFITFEMLNNTERGKLFQTFVKKPQFFVDNKGTRWCVRKNSILKQDPSYLAFIIDAVYLTANMVGEMTFGNLNNRNPNIMNTALELIDACDKWILDRMVESVLMAILGNSQEEGLLSGLRKVFMLKLNWSRTKEAWGSDVSGFADSINECLLDQPLALYFAKQFRDILDD